EVCFRNDVTRKDPSFAPPSCLQTEDRGAAAPFLPGAAARMEEVMGQAAIEARERDFTAAIEHTLYWEVGAFLAVFSLVFLLPKKPRPQSPEQPPTTRRDEGGRL
ncbi:MAG TPA: hypothetical protein VE225_01055, partial [Rubrobacteraceae bacterium]|nr:hypothetical protein [Rubrobacteraceae bacterium]